MKNTNWSALLILNLFLIPLFIGCSSKETITPRPQPVGPTLSNVSYGSGKDWEGNNVNLTMDIYQPANMVSGRKYPLVMHLHGGAFSPDGDKTSAADKCLLLADSGFIAVTINYRVGWNSSNNGDPCAGDTVSFNDALYRAMQDERAALRFLVSKADEYSIDTNWIFLSGASAGADVILNSSYVDDKYAKARYPKSVAKLGPLDAADNNLKNTYTIKGICAIAGALPDSNLINSNRAYPAISFQGEDDEVVPVNFGTYLDCSNYAIQYGSLCQYRQLVAVGVPAVAHVLPNSGHGNNGDSGYDNPFMMSNAACFFHGLIGKEKPGSGIYIGIVNSCQ